MLNIEKYKHELIEMGAIDLEIMLGFSKDGKLINCNFTKCGDCKKILMAQSDISEEEFYKESCRKNILKWLFSECKETKNNGWISCSERWWNRWIKIKYKLTQIG